MVTEVDPYADLLSGTDDLGGVLDVVDGDIFSFLVADAEESEVGADALAFEEFGSLADGSGGDGFPVGLLEIADYEDFALGVSHCGKDVDGLVEGVDGGGGLEFGSLSLELGGHAFAVESGAVENGFGFAAYEERGDVGAFALGAQYAFDRGERLFETGLGDPAGLHGVAVVEQDDGGGGYVASRGLDGDAFIKYGEAAKSVGQDVDHDHGGHETEGDAKFGKDGRDDEENQGEDREDDPVEELIPFLDDHASQAQGEEDGDSATDEQEDELLDLDPLTVYPDDGFEQMDSAPFDDPELTPVEHVDEDGDGAGGRADQGMPLMKVMLGQATRLRLARK